MNTPRWAAPIGFYFVKIWLVQHSLLFTKQDAPYSSFLCSRCQNSSPWFFFFPKWEACILQNEGQTYLFIYLCVYVPSGSFTSRLLLMLPRAAATPAAIRGGPGGCMAEGCRPRRTACCHLPHPAPQYLIGLFSSAPLPLLQFSYCFVTWHCIQPSACTLSGRIYWARSEARMVPDDRHQLGQPDNQEHLRLCFCHRNHTSAVPLQQPLAGSDSEDAALDAREGNSLITTTEKQLLAEKAATRNPSKSFLGSPFQKKSL